MFFSTATLISNAAANIKSQAMELLDNTKGTSVTQMATANEILVIFIMT